MKHVSMGDSTPGAGAPAHTRRLRVVHITTVDTSLRYLLLNQLQSLQHAGYEVAAISAPGEHVAVIEATGIRHIAVPMSRTITPLADLGALWHLTRVLRREDPTIVHTHTPKPGLLGQLAARLAGVPIVVNTIHGFYFHSAMSPVQRRFYILLERIAARCSDAILSQNREDMQTALRLGICPAHTISYLGNGIDLTRFDPLRVGEAERYRVRQELDIPRDAPVAGFVGRLAGRRKGFRDFLAASQRVLEQMPQARFLVVGEADHGKPDAVEPLAAADYGIVAACRFVGHRLNEELPRLYRAMDVLVLPSLFEGIPRVVMEAAAMQVPAIVTDVKGNREVVEHGCTGLKVALGDVAALAGAMCDLLSSKERVQYMGEASRRMAEERFDERRVFATVQAQYRRRLDARGIAMPFPRRGLEA